MTSYTFSASQLDAFKTQWPCHGIPSDLMSLRFEYADNGDLVDLDAFDVDGERLGEHWDYHTDGGALVALSTDGWELANGRAVYWQSRQAFSIAPLLDADFDAPAFA